MKDMCNNDSCRRTCRNVHFRCQLLHKVRARIRGPTHKITAGQRECDSWKSGCIQIHPSLAHSTAGCITLTRKSEGSTEMNDIAIRRTHQCDWTSRNTRDRIRDTDAANLIGIYPLQRKEMKRGSITRTQFESEHEKWVSNEPWQLQSKGNESKAN